MAKWVVAKSIYNNIIYEVWKICSSEKKCKEYISSFPKKEQKEFFYFKKEY